MEPNQDFEGRNEVPGTPHKRSFWQKLGGGSLSVSLILHVVLILVGLIWVFQIIPAEQEKVVDFMPKSGGGGSPSSDSQAKKQRVQMTQPNLSRVSAVGAMSSIVLPEPEEVTQMTSVGSISSGGLSGGLGGTGSGGGKGDGMGKGFGSGMAPGMSNGTGNKNPFGMLDINPSALVGTFYDLKQTRAGKPTDLSNSQVVEEINNFVNHGWRESSFNKFFKAPETLYQSKLYIPTMNADAAPAAFNCADKVKPSRWVVVYRGVITPPHTGKFRFVGYGDDILVIRFNGKNVFDHGYYSGTTPTYIAQNHAAMQAGDPAIKKELKRDYPMELPLKTYTYDTTDNANGSLGGLAVGPSFEAEAGKNYPIDILINELPGGLFGTSLLIEEEGQTYQKTSGGSPILPLFRVDGSVPEPTKAGNSPPYDPNGPIWKVVSERRKADI